VYVNFFFSSRHRFHLSLIKFICTFVKGGLGFEVEGKVDQQECNEQ